MKQISNARITQKGSNSYSGQSIPACAKWIIEDHVRKIFGLCRWTHRRTRIEKDFRLEPRSDEFRVKFGQNNTIRRWVWLKDMGEMHFGNNVKLGRNCIIAANQDVYIDNNILIADNVSIRDADHIYSDPDLLIREQGMRFSPVRIGNDVWIGYGVVVTAGVEIGDGCVIGANAVVTRSMPPYSVFAGVPARVIKSRKA